MAENGIDHTKLLANQPYDESLSVYDDEDVASSEPSPRAPLNKSMDPDMSDDEFDHDDEEEEEEDEDVIEVSAPPKQPNGTNVTAQVQQMSLDPGVQAKAAVAQVRPGGGAHVIGGSDDDDDDDDDEESSEEDETVQQATEGAYDPADYEHLPVSQEIKELFQYITRYTPQTVDLEYKLKPFIPEYIPAVGDIDAFLKVSKPDLKPERLGLQVLDEPCAKQSDPTVLDLQLRSISKATTGKQMVVRSIEDAEHNQKAVDAWIESIGDLHKDKPPQTVMYTKTMPDIEQLMQEWPPEFEEMLKHTSLPTADLDMELNEYVDMICAILDIPVYPGGRVQALHVLFTLYSEFKNSQHFNQLARDNLVDNVQS